MSNRKSRSLKPRWKIPQLKRDSDPVIIHKTTCSARSPARASALHVLGHTQRKQERRWGKSVRSAKPPCTCQNVVLGCSCILQLIQHNHRVIPERLSLIFPQFHHCAWHLQHHTAAQVAHPGTQLTCTCTSNQFSSTPRSRAWPWPCHQPSQGCYYCRKEQQQKGNVIKHLNRPVMQHSWMILSHFVI